MAHIDSNSGGRRKSFDVNLVPFIDLMSVLITFLLITAVWTQVSLIQIGTSIYGKRSETPSAIPPKADVPLKLEVKATGYFLQMGAQQTKLPLVQGQFDDTQLLAQLQRFKELNPEKLDAAIALSDEIPYDRLIRGIDLFLKAGFPTISILTGGP